MSASKALRRLISGPSLTFLMEAHNGLSARIAESEGFQALWASSLSISTALGVRDADEISWSQMLDAVGHIVDAASVPVLVDGNSGFGNFNSARRFARHAARIGAGGVCFEDKIYPKTNSFAKGRQALFPTDEFARLIQACKSYQSDPDFVLVARTESFIAGASVDEAIARASAYADAGADAIFVHSKKSTAEEIEKFAAAWNGKPLIIAPTTYARTPTNRFRDLSISGVIWANHNMRASLSAMRDVCRRIRIDECVGALDEEIAPISHVFSLLAYDDLHRDEQQYQ